MSFSIIFSHSLKNVIEIFVGLNTEFLDCFQNYSQIQNINSVYSRTSSSIYLCVHKGSSSGFLHFFHNCFLFAYLCRTDWPQSLGYLSSGLELSHQVQASLVLTVLLIDAFKLLI